MIGSTVQVAIFKLRSTVQAAIYNIAMYKIRSKVQVAMYKNDLYLKKLCKR